MAPLALLLLVACPYPWAGGMPPPELSVSKDAQAAPRFFTERVADGRYRMSPGKTATLRLPPNAPEPRLTGTAVILIPVAAFAPTGTKEWEVRAVSGGTAVLDAVFDGQQRSWTLVVTDAR